MTKFSRQTLPEQFLQAESFVNLVWEICEENFEHCCNAIKETINNNLFSKSTTIDILCAISIFRPRKTRILYKCILTLADNFDIDQVFFRSTALKSALADTTHNNKSYAYIDAELDDILNIYKKNEIGYCLLNDDLENFQKLTLNQSFDINTRMALCNEPQSKETTYLNVAARYGAINCFKYLNLNGLMPDSDSFNLAILGGNFEIIKILSSTANITNVSLQKAVTSHRNEIAHWLIENYELKCSWESMLRNYNFTFFIDSLCSCPTLDTFDYQNDTPLIASCRIDILWLSKFLMEHTKDINHYNNQKVNAILCASMGKNEELINILLDKGADINSHNAKDATPLMVAYSNNRREIAQLLIKKGGKTNGESNDLFCAIEHNDYWTVDMLLKQGADVNQTFRIEKVTPLFHAVYHRLDELVSLILQYKPNVNQRVGYGQMTALMEACKNGSEIIVRKLLETGADVNMMDENCHDALYYANLSNSSEIIKMIEEKLEKPDENIEN
ncbi:hypothetical protein TVAG_005500 [Trichomonas vaginalis G3]|uniref:DUF3447 domain-containing protein n=1 Tax=Trichomonas vaginalis (strain ATCC PRA-98 / G3) TaxID=412133 RepID=A2ENT0_TRIV3|nr:nerve growth factor signaling pathway [Trichomonas vaginalis G3]EAY05706.1 hypothetical protein TVAG_005500 [Trichomonas vaginalis G3]KAI5506886.1 nerve growth factor signaling pathway [Trichomonas vaginalis G3]|eukprot:XP_001317929.1 hypothetical protein [Trichomonas vaginalis G3]